MTIHDPPSVRPTFLPSLVVAMMVMSTTVLRPVEAQTLDSAAKESYVRERTFSAIAAQGARNRLLDEVQIVSPVDDFSGFGLAADIRNGLLVVGAPYEMNSGVSSGAAYVYRHDGVDWLPEARLSAPDTTRDQRFGDSVTLDRNPSGDFVAVGAPGNSKAWVFRNSGGSNWRRIQEFQGPAGSGYGRDVAARRGRLLVTAPIEGQSGVIHVFEWTGATYDSVTAIATDDIFHFVGNRLSFDGDRAVVTTGSFEPISAKVYVLGTRDGEWSPPHLLDTSSDVTTGLPVAISGDHLVLSGGLVEGDEALHVYERTGDTWANVASIPAPVEQGALCFGCSVALSDNLLFVGSPSDNGLAAFAGAVYVYAGAGSIWRQVLKVTASDGKAWEALGNDVVCSDGIRLVAGSNKSPETVYVFTLPTDLSSQTTLELTSGVLIEAFPTPFSASVVIEFTLPHPDTPHLSIYDITGRLRGDVNFGYLPAGTYRHRWAPRDAAAGVYAVTLTAGSLWARRAIVFVR